MGEMDELAKGFIKGYLKVRTNGVSAQHRLDTRQDLWLVTDKYFSRKAAEAALDELLLEGDVIEMGPYLGTYKIDVL